LARTGGSSTSPSTTTACTPPHAYYRIPNPEDRLFIPDEFTSLFEIKGWKRQR